VDPHDLDPDYDRHGGFPQFEPAAPGPGFGRFVEGMRRLQDLAVSADPDGDTWDAAADRVGELVKLLTPYQAAEGVGPANRTLELPAAGSLLAPPWSLEQFDTDGVRIRVQFSRFHVGGNNAVHGGVLPLLFDGLFGMIIHAAGRPVTRTAHLEVDYRKVTPIDTPLIASGHITAAQDRKAYISAELRDTAGALLAESTGLMIRLLPGQP
jgi:acyl-coenzyme A thioesterase PaaI-like protein